MPLNYFCFTSYAIWACVLLMPQRTEGISCFSCSSKSDAGCKNDDLKNGYRNNMYSKECPASDDICIKYAIVVKNYYEEHYSKEEMKRYYTAVQKAAECRGIGVSTVNGSPAGNGTAAGAEGGHPGGSTAAGPGGGSTSNTTGLPEAAVAVTKPAEEDGGGGRRRRAVADDCPAYPDVFPEPQALVERSDQRWSYFCGNRFAWRNYSLQYCYKNSDGILMRTICLCDHDLCNGAGLSGAAPFLVLAAALAHLRGVTG